MSDYSNDDFSLADDFLIASASNSIVSDIDSYTEVQDGSYEAILIDRLNVISISVIISTCLLFLLLIHKRRR